MHRPTARAVRDQGRRANTRGSYLFAILGLRGAPRGQRLAAYSLSDPVRLAWLDRDRGYNPWKITSGDVDGDGGVEVCVIVWKKTRVHPVLDNRPFIFAWDGTQLYPKWLGSRLSSPFVDLALGDLDGDGADELIALEWRRDGRKRVMSYKWSGFGFEAFKILRDDVRWRALPDGRFRDPVLRSEDASGRARHPAFVAAATTAE